MLIVEKVVSIKLLSSGFLIPLNLLRLSRAILKMKTFSQDIAMEYAKGEGMIQTGSIILRMLKN